MGMPTPLPGEGASRMVVGAAATAGLGRKNDRSTHTRGKTAEIGNEPMEGTVKLRKLAVLAGATAGVLALSSAPAFAQDCFLTHASANSHQGKSNQWGAFQLSDVLAAPAPEGFGLQCAEQVDAAVAQVQAAGLPTTFFSRTDKVLPDAGGPGKGGIDHFEDSPIVGVIGAIAGQVQATVPCP